MIRIELKIEEAAAVYRALRDHCIPPNEDQRPVYDFVHRLEMLIEMEELDMRLEDDQRKRELGK